MAAGCWLEDDPACFSCAEGMFDAGVCVELSALAESFITVDVVVTGSVATCEFVSVAFSLQAIVKITRNIEKYLIIMLLILNDGSTKI